MTADDELRLKLEDAAPLLEATAAALRVLVPALEAWRWQARVRALHEIARQVVRHEAASRAALARARRRALAEGWPAGATRAWLDEVSALCARLDAAVTDRGFPDLQTLVRSLVGVRRAVPLADRDDAAAAVLHPDEPEVQVLSRFGAALEALGARKVVRGQRLPFTLEAFDAVQAQWAPGVRALPLAWARLAGLDTSGGVEHALRRRARLAPKGLRGHPGPRALVHADYWLTTTTAQWAQVVDERFAPVRVREGERVEALRYLLRREVDGAALLGPAPRDALLMLAHELTCGPEGRAALGGGAAQVLRWATAADALEGDDDWRRLREGLRALRGRSVGPAVPPLYRVGVTPVAAAQPVRLADFFTAPHQL